MPLPNTHYFDKTLRPAYEALCRTPQATQFFKGVFRYQGQALDETSTFQLEDVVMSSREAAQLLMVFDGSRVSMQEQHGIGVDDAPPGTYFTIINQAVVQSGHKNRIGIYEEATGSSLHLGDATEDLMAPGFLDEEERVADVARAVFMDHIFLRQDAPHYLGTVAFALCAMTAHRMAFTRISLIAGGGREFHTQMIGYFFWPKMGFDAPLTESEREALPEFGDCKTVLELCAINEQWWCDNGAQRWMEFDLQAESPSWRKLLDYLRMKELI